MSRERYDLKKGYYRLTPKETERTNVIAAYLHIKNDTDNMHCDVVKHMTNGVELVENLHITFSKSLWNLEDSNPEEFELHETLASV